MSAGKFALQENPCMCRPQRRNAPARPDAARKFACDVTPGKFMAQIPCCRKILACVRPGLDPHAAHLRVAGLRVAAGTPMHVCRKICMRRDSRQNHGTDSMLQENPCSHACLQENLRCRKILACADLSAATPQPDLMLRENLRAT